MENCRWCNQAHGPKCPLVKAIEFHEDGITVKRVEFLTPSDYLSMQPPLLPLPFPAPPPLYPAPERWIPPEVWTWPNIGGSSISATGLH